MVTCCMVHDLYAHINLKSLSYRYYCFIINNGKKMGKTIKFNIHFYTKRVPVSKIKRHFAGSTVRITSGKINMSLVVVVGLADSTSSGVL